MATTRHLIASYDVSSLTWEQWCIRIREVVILKEKLPWYIGDLLVAGEKFGEQAWQFISDLRYSPGALANFKSVAKAIPPEMRADLPWSVYADLRPLPAEERERIVSQALAGKLTRDEIRALKHAAEAANGNGAVSSESGSQPVPSAMGAQIERLAQAMVMLGRLLRRKSHGEDCNEALKEALDVATAEMVALSGML